MRLSFMYCSCGSGILGQKAKNQELLFYFLKISGKAGKTEKNRPIWCVGCGKLFAEAAEKGRENWVTREVSHKKERGKKEKAKLQLFLWGTCVREEIFLDPLLLGGEYWRWVRFFGQPPSFPSSSLLWLTLGQRKKCPKVIDSPTKIRDGSHWKNNRNKTVFEQKVWGIKVCATKFYFSFYLVNAA